MKRMISIAVAFWLVLSFTYAQAQHAGAQPSCKFCGMDREKFSHTAMTIEYEDGTAVGTCSLHCTAIDLALNIDKNPKVILVGDYLSKKPVNADTACWTIGGDLPGVMTKRAKWAFESRTDCEKFAAEHSARIVAFEEALKAAYEDMHADTKMIRDKRKARKGQ